MDPLISNNKRAQSQSNPVDIRGGFKPLSKATVSANCGSLGSKDTADHASHPKVEAVEVDGVVKSIQVTCSCGEVILIDCQYTD
jgi:hypothetical protein